MEIYYEQSVCGERSRWRSFLYGLCWAFSGAAVLLAVFFASNVLGSDPNELQINFGSLIGMALSLCAALLVYFRKDYLHREYDYILRGDVLEISAILNGRRRRKLATLHLNRVHAVGMAASARCASLQKQRGLRMHAWSVRPGTHYIYYIEENVRHMALLELDDQIAALIHRQLPVGVWQSIEGK